MSDQSTHSYLLYSILWYNAGRMPRKTRKQKIVAALRRSQKQRFSSQTAEANNGTNEEMGSFLIVNSVQVKKDLLKSLIISGFAILSEGVLYWLWRGH